MDYTDELFDFSEEDKPVDCLGMHFNSDKERKAYFIEKLREKLKDPEFRKIEGFPIGEDEDILAISDPPYYCACPNPWTAEIISEWEAQKPKTDVPYSREPFAADVSEGKNDPIYNAHSYHTKVPYKAIMRYILHYTNPGDIVFDGFCGSGMTGVAAQMCGDAEAVRSLGYEVATNGDIYQSIINNDTKNRIFVSKIGARKFVLNDLAPSATFISANYNSTIDRNKFKKDVDIILSKLEDSLGWMYETKLENGDKASINYIAWSSVYICPICGEEISYYDLTFNKEKKELYFEMVCPKCKSKLTKNMMKRKIIKYYDSNINQLVESIQQNPILINYTYKGVRGEKRPDEKDLALIKKINEIDFNYWFPTDLMMRKGTEWGDSWRAGVNYGITRVNQFYTKRTLLVLSAISKLCNDNTKKFLFGSVLPKMTLCNRYMPQHGSRALVGPMANTLYTPPMYVEHNVFNSFNFQLQKIFQALQETKTSSDYLITTQGLQSVAIPNNSIDYLFVDPPFGRNIMYSELSFIRESWLKVYTNNIPEAIENDSQCKGINEYRKLMTSCFLILYKALKPGKWMTVEFSNTDSSVWNSIQIGLSEVGFIIASVSALDKHRGGLHSIIGSTAVKQDLIISCYKPDEDFEKQVVTEVGEDAVWTFVRKHLSYLPLIKEQGEATITVPERDPRIIYDRMVSFFVSHNMLLPISSPDFLQKIEVKFVVRDGLCYLPQQAIDYEKILEKKQITIIEEDTSLFVEDERTAISWIRGQLKKRPRTLGELTPMFMQQISAWSKFEKKLELINLLEDNFYIYKGEGTVPSPIHSHLSTFYKDMRNLENEDPILRAKAKGYWCVPDPKDEAQIAQVRERHLLKEFDAYLLTKGKIKNNLIRIEAVRAGFKRAYSNKDYQTIVSFAERMPSDVVESDDKLLLWYNNASARLE